MKKKLKRFIAVLAVPLCLCLSCLMTTPYDVAAATIDGSTAQTIETTTDPTTDGSQTPAPADGFQSATGTSNTATIEDLQDKIDEKGSDVVNLLKTVGSKAMLIAFGVCGIMCIIAAISKKGGMSKFIVGMVLCGVLWACMDSAPEIVSFIGNWVKK